MARPSARICSADLYTTSFETVVIAIEDTKMRVPNHRIITEVLTAQRWHIVMASPMASGPDPPIPVLSESQVAKTVITRTKVMKSSTPNTCPSDTPRPGVGVHTTSLSVDVYVSALRSAAPTIAPTDCTTMYRKALYSTNPQHWRKTTESTHELNQQVSVIFVLIYF